VIPRGSRGLSLQWTAQLQYRQADIMSNQISFFMGEIQEQQEAWKVEHEQLKTNCWVLEDLLRRGIGLFQIISMGDVSWSRKVQSNSIAFDPEMAKKFHEAYTWWLLPCEAILSDLAKSEVKYKVEGAEQFRDCIRLAKRSAAIDIERLIESMNQKRVGEVVTVNEVFWDGINGTNARRTG
jgi:hypothetical protein